MLGIGRPTTAPLRDPRLGPLAYVLAGLVLSALFFSAGCATPARPAVEPKRPTTIRRPQVSALEAEKRMEEDYQRISSASAALRAPKPVFISSSAPRTTVNEIGVPSDRIDRHPHYRIPALLRANNGRLLAFAEGRYAEYSDHGKVDIVLKVSDDGGETWSRERLLVSDISYDSTLRRFENTCGNPAPVYDNTTGRIWLLWTWNRGDMSEQSVTSMKVSHETSRLPYAIYSDDNGETWWGPTGEFTASSGRKNAFDLSATCKEDSWTWFATGPGSGICTRSGELLVGANFHKGDTDLQSYGAVILKYDRASGTWRRSGVPTPLGFGTNETAIVELTDGRIALNCRHHRESPRTRLVHITSDMGWTWERSFYDESLPDPRCQGSLISMRAGQEDQSDRLVLANLDKTDTDGRRRNALSLRISYDDGRVWTRPFRLRKPVAEITTDLLGRTTVKRSLVDKTGYSSMAALDDSTIAILYEGNALYPNGADTGQFGVIMFQVVTIQDILKALPKAASALKGK